MGFGGKGFVEENQCHTSIIIIESVMLSVLKKSVNSKLYNLAGLYSRRICVFSENEDRASVPKEWNNNNWEVHDDVGYQNVLSRSSKLPMSYSDLIPPSIPPVESFRTMYLKTKATELRNGAVYRNDVENVPYMFITAHDIVSPLNVILKHLLGNEEPTASRVVSYHVCCIGDPLKKPIILDNVRKSAEFLGLYDADSKHVCMRYVYYVNLREKVKHGIKFVDYVVDEENRTRAVEYDIHSLKEKFPGEFDYLDTKIVCLGIFPNLNKNKSA